MGPTEDTLGKDGLGDAVALQLRRDSLGQLFGVDLLDLTAAAASGGGRRVGRLEGGGGAAAGMLRRQRVVQDRRGRKDGGGVRQGR